MTSERFKIFQITFHMCCWIATISMIIVWLYRYCQNEDLCDFDYRNYYQTQEDVHPMLSICLNRPFSQENLDRLGVNETEYIKFLEGSHFDSKLLNIDFNSIRLNASNYIKRYWITFINGSSIEHVFKPEMTPFLELSYSGFIDSVGFVNCHALKVPDGIEVGNVRNLGVLLNYSIFPTGERPIIHGFDTLIHYPNQLLRSLDTHQYGWNPIDKGDVVIMRFRINNMEVIKRRNKLGNPCHGNWNNDDDELLVQHTQAIGCRAPYQYPSKDIKICNTSEALAASRFTISAMGYNATPPCKAVGKIYFSFEETTRARMSASDYPDSFWVAIYFMGQQFKEIVKKR